MQRYKINHYFSYSPMKAAHAERVIRTLKMKIMRFQTLFGTFRYIDDLNEIIESYNNTKHSKIKMAPNKVDKNKEQMLLKTVYRNDNNPKPSKEKIKFKKDQFVRISRIKNIFEKGKKIFYSISMTFICLFFFFHR